MRLAGLPSTTTLLLLLSIVPDAAAAGKHSWTALDPTGRSAALSFAGNYKDFLGRARNEETFVTEAIRLARDAGFSEWTETSDAFNDFLAALIHRQEGGDYSEMLFRQALGKTWALSVDTTVGLHPIWPSNLESENASAVGKGVSFKMYGRGNSPNAEFTARLRRLFDDHGLPWQVGTYKVGVGGGGTIATFLSDDNMEVMDVGVPILSMHSPYEVSSKADVYTLFLGLRAFFADFD